MEDCARDAVGFFSQSSVWTSSYIVRDLDLASLARLSSYSSRYEGRGRSSFPRGHQSTCRTRMALYRRRCRVSRLALLRVRRFQREEPVVDRHARHRELPATDKFSYAAGTACK